MASTSICNLASPGGIGERCGQLPIGLGAMALAAACRNQRRQAGVNGRVSKDVVRACGAWRGCRCDIVSQSPRRLHRENSWIQSPRPRSTEKSPRAEAEERRVDLVRKLGLPTLNIGTVSSPGVGWQLQVRMTALAAVSAPDWWCL